MLHRHNCPPSCLGMLSIHLFLISSRERNRKSDSVDSTNDLNATRVPVLLNNRILAVGVHEKSDEIWSHVMAALMLLVRTTIRWVNCTYKVSESFGQVALIKIDLQDQLAIFT